MKKLGLGMMRLPLAAGGDQGKVDMDQVCRMVDRFLERGFTYFDTAYMYHNHESERVVREALVRRHDRDSFLLADKLPLVELKTGTRADQERIFREQLEKCGVDYFDYYLLHDMSAAQYETARRLDSFAFVRERQAAGQVRHIGFSFHDTPALLDEILTDHPEFEFVQLQINYLDWNSQAVQAAKCYETAVRHGKKVVVMEPVRGGRLAQLAPEAEAALRKVHPDWSPAVWALRFAAGLEEVMVVLSGMSNLEQLEDNTGHMDQVGPLTAEERTALDTALGSLAMAIPCTGCRYCTEGCPQKIAIPEYFALYNQEKRAVHPDRDAQHVYYTHYTREFGRASDCVACGQCEEMCPQHLHIIDLLKRVAETFEA